jgi:hypothetical protein
MGGLIQLAMAGLIAAGKAGSVRDATLRLTAAAFCAVLAVVLLLAALACAAAALWIFTLPSLGPVGAPLAVAGTLTAVMLVMAAAAGLILRRRRPASGIDMAPQFLLSEATRLFSEHKGAVLLAAALAGMAAANGGRKP